MLCANLVESDDDDAWDDLFEDDEENYEDDDDSEDSDDGLADYEAGKFKVIDGYEVPSDYDEDDVGGRAVMKRKGG